MNVLPAVVHHLHPVLVLTGLRQPGAQLQKHWQIVAAHNAVAIRVHLKIQKYMRDEYPACSVECAPSPPCTCTCWSPGTRINSYSAPPHLLQGKFANSYRIRLLISLYMITNWLSLGMQVWIEGPNNAWIRIRNTPSGPGVGLTSGIFNGHEPRMFVFGVLGWITNLLRKKYQPPNISLKKKQDGIFRLFSSGK